MAKLAVFFLDFLCFEFRRSISNGLSETFAIFFHERIELQCLLNGIQQNCAEKTNNSVRSLRK